SPRASPATNECDCDIASVPRPRSRSRVLHAGRLPAPPSGPGRPSIDPVRPASTESAAAATPRRPADPSSPGAGVDLLQCSRSPPPHSPPLPPRAADEPKTRHAPPHNSSVSPRSAEGRIAVSLLRFRAAALTDPLRRSSDGGWVSPTPARTPAASAVPTTRAPYTTPRRLPSTPVDGVPASSLNSLDRKSVV